MGLKEGAAWDALHLALPFEYRNSRLVHRHTVTRAASLLAAPSSASRACDQSHWRCALLSSVYAALRLTFLRPEMQSSEGAPHRPSNEVSAHVRFKFEALRYAFVVE